ncbi:MAG: 2-oxo acid dehydrogenase subunit E2, partial [Candidatus Heimdallarchaeota archaeon]|nr:2-oxo acid dehydrogenase subunit E2 [Candidatus Heimdallarchaeota archaeon]
MDNIGSFESKPFRRFMNQEVVEMSRFRYYIFGVAELDVTKARKILREYKEKTGETISFSAWITKCVAQAISDNKIVHSMKRRRKLIIFDDVDIQIPIEKIIDGRTYPSLLVVRKANEQSVLDIHEQIRGKQEEDSDEVSSEVSRRKFKILYKFPKFMRRRIFWNRLQKNPFMLKRLSGTCQIVSIGMFGPGRKGWGTNVGFLPIHIVLGGISDQPRYEGDKLVKREILSLMIKLDHVTIDGGPATRF